MTASEVRPALPARRQMMLGTIVAEVWAARELLTQLVQRDLRLRYRQAVMGIAWALLMPVLTVSAGLIVRLAMAHGGRQEGLPSVGGIAIKSWAWTFFAGAMNFGTVSLLSNMSLVTKIYFPREVLPLSSIATQSIDSLLGLGVILLFGPWIGFHVSVQLFWVPVLIFLLLTFTTGLAFLFACANLFFRDVKYILQVLLMFGIFFTPVFFEPTTFSARVGGLMMLNPLAPILEGLRLAMTQSDSLLRTITNTSGHVVWSPWLLVYASAVAVILLVTGLIAFRRTATMFAEYY